MLEQSDIAHYLLSLGLVKPRAVVDEDLTIVDASRRNSVFIATTRAGPTYVVKQAGPRSVQTLRHEAAVLRELARTTKLADQVPDVVHHDPESAILVLRSPAAARDWNERHAAGRFPPAPAAALGRALAALHGLPTNVIEGLPTGVDRMWGLSLAEPPHSRLLDLSLGAQDLVARLQASVAMCARLGEVREAASDADIVHGDVRWDNCLSVAAPGAARRTRLVLIDWELAGRGAAAFDLGSIFAEYLCAWAGSIPIVDPTDPDRLAGRAQRPLGRMAPAIRALWLAYRKASSRQPTLRLVTEMAAVRVLQSAVEGAQGLRVASAHVVMLVQLAENMLRAPDDAALQLLGLRE